MTFDEALREWRRKGGVLETLWDADVGQIWIAREHDEALDGANWRETCESALREAGWSDERIAREMKF